ncbi:hypothetical protein K435DRAFT_761043 [Dendrothele bispora CBS 962.96]|uniref:Uncharacterized protein n=1 Tax=Dendrothele bispora (strain CBS 962.96) TaxID=1314807 RepID=A0A4S8LHC2_DENBC|nr:hypothetical protein K435DRAFT_761880 [Dendrothele bispora CBS 962.96]THU89540.1 hypothetical protein K435DRAFT_761043 [Dendrothele bispora CBS 962.96]
MASYEMTDLSKRSSEEDKDSVQIHGVEDNSISWWTLTSAAFFGIFSAILVLFPRLLLFLSETATQDNRPSLTSLETFLATHFGIWLVAIAISLVLTMPSQSPLHTPKTSTHPLLVITTITSLFAALVSYNTRSVGVLATLYAAASSIVGLWGLWALVFEGSAHVSRKTGADKHTSSFIFGNKSSASQRKKQWKKEGGDSSKP